MMESDTKRKLALLLAFTGFCTSRQDLERMLCPGSFHLTVEDMPGVEVEVIAPKKRKGPPVLGKKGKIQRW